MSDANRVQLAYIVEPSDAFGEKVTGSNLQILRYNGESLKHDMVTTVSEEIRSDRQISDVARIGLSASGGIDFELSYGSHDDFLKAALLSDSDWSTGVENTAKTISASDSENALIDSGSGFGSFAAYRWIYVIGFTGAAAVNNGFHKIGTVAAGKLTLAGSAIVDGSAGDRISVFQGKQIVNGSTFYSYNLEKYFKDISGSFSLFKGMNVNTFSLEVPADGIITGSFGFLGSEEEELTTPVSGLGTSAYTSETDTVIMTGANHVPNFIENSIDISILSFSMSLNNNLRTRLQVGTLGVVDMGLGTVEITGSITLHLANATLYNKYLNQTKTSIAIAVQDADGNGYVIELPSVKIIDGTRPAGGLNTDVIGTFEFRAYMDSLEEKSIRITRFQISDITDQLAGSVIAASNVSVAGITHSRDGGASWPYGPEVPGGAQ